MASHTFTGQSSTFHLVDHATGIDPAVDELPFGPGHEDRAASAGTTIRVYADGQDYDLTVQVTLGPPPATHLADLDEQRHVVEVTLDLPSGTLAWDDLFGDQTSEPFDVGSTGIHTARIAWAHCDDENHTETIHVHLWPTPDAHHCAGPDHHTTVLQRAPHHAATSPTTSTLADGRARMHGAAACEIRLGWQPLTYVAHEDNPLGIRQFFRAPDGQVWVHTYERVGQNPAEPTLTHATETELAEALIEAGRQAQQRSAGLPATPRARPSLVTTMRDVAKAAAQAFRSEMTKDNGPEPPTPPRDDQRT